ncbi:SMI1/KNR4 family protein [Halopiger goleimassiliensis]|uniref:SMI1/KNR4 family protein n=1 Tax=Halopiger goleimassiliensis TaxID=1293048 RepID=UPI000677C34A|nr:SMI1/KNR4 family protein [Halopiger goleimassiliensis]
MRSIRECWTVIENWLATNHSDGRSVLSPPAADEQIDAVESTVGVDLPDAFVKFLRIHNGQTSGSRPLLRRFGLCSTESIRAEWERMTDLLEDDAFTGEVDDFPDRFKNQDAAVKDVWWHESWVPFAQDPSGNLLCLDLAPGADGNEGPVIVVWHDMPARPVRGPSFHSWFAEYATAIETDELVYSEQTNSMMADPEELASLPPERIENPTREDLQPVFERHYERCPPDGNHESVPNWVVEVCLERQGEVGSRVQFQWGSVTIRELVEDGQLSRAKNVCEEEDLAIVEEGDVFITATQPTVDAEPAAAVTKRILSTVYDSEVADIVEIRERKL